MNRFWSNEQVEARAEARVAEYEARFGRIPQPPVPIERLIDEIFDLRILWEPIEANGAISPLAGIRPADRQIVVNEDHRSTFAASPALLNFSFAHELGHWDLHVDHTEMSHPTFVGFEADSGAFRHFRSSGGDVQVLLGRLHRLGITGTDAYEAVREVTRGEDDLHEARQANRYAATLLMPRALVRRAVEGQDLLRWPALYRLRDQFQVSISAMTIRLETMGLVYIAPDRRIHRSKAEALGQTALFE
jgi:hypothetical protein